MSMQEEIQFVIQVITHSAGYDLDLFGYFSVRPTDQGVWCVSYENSGESSWEKSFLTAEEAAAYFVNKRHEEKIGIDFENMMIISVRDI